MFVFIKALKKAYEGLRLIGGTFEPDDIFKIPRRKANLIESLDLVNTTLGEDLVKQKLLTDSQLNIIKVRECAKLASRSLSFNIVCHLP